MDKNEYLELKGDIKGLKDDMEMLAKAMAAGFSKMEKDFKELLDLAANNFSNIYTNLDRLEETKADKQDADRMMDAIDASTKEFSDQKQEHAMLVGQVNRNKDWIKKIAKKTDVQLDY